VHPIVEESDSMRGSTRNGSSLGGGRDSMRSYASSNAIPIGIPDYYLQSRDSVPSLPDAPSEYGDESPVEPMPPLPLQWRDRLAERGPLPPPPPLPIHGREERLSEGELSSPDPVSLVREASLGRKSRPTLTTVKSNDRARKDVTGNGLSSLPSQQRNVPDRKALPTQQKGLSKEVLTQPSENNLRPAKTDRYEANSKAPEAGAAAGMLAAAVYSQKKPAKDDRKAAKPIRGALDSGTGLHDPPPFESNKAVKKKSSMERLGAAIPRLHRQSSRDRSPLAREADPRESILGGLAGGGALGTQQAEQFRTPAGGLAERAGKRRPPRINVDAVKEAESRGSLTSLPDLISRATRLASNLDRGKTASRLGTDWIVAAEADEEKHRSVHDHRHSGNLSDILASFPAPALVASPPGARADRPVTRWSANLRHSHLPSESDAVPELQKEPKRKCCGMPVWLFVVLLILLILVVVAAIVVPVILIGRNSTRDTVPTTAAATCSNPITCANGGVSVAGTDQSCRCVCVNGFTGTTCATASQAACTTTQVGPTRNATVGEVIPRLLAGAGTNFSVPLDGQTLLGLFSSKDMSCTSENALVTFNNNNNNNAKRSPPPMLEARVAASPTIQPRQATTTTDSTDNAATSGGIVFESGSPTAGTSSAGATATSSPSSSTSSSSPIANSTTVIDFARVAVLYILQTSGQLGDAITAQESLQAYFATGQSSSGQAVDASNVTLGNGVSCDLNGFRIGLGNGTVVGGRSSSSSSSGSSPTSSSATAAGAAATTS